MTQDEFKVLRTEAQLNIRDLLESDPYGFVDWEQRDVLEEFVGGLSVMDPMVMRKLEDYLKDEYGKKEVEQ